MSEGVKRAALALSSLNKGDRDWILENLDQTDRDRLARVLSQVEDLGVRVAAQDVDLLFKESQPSPPPMPTQAGPLSPKQRVIQAEATDILRAVGDEPDWMVAALCGMHQWPWLAEFLGLLREERAIRVQRYMRTQADHSPAVCEALVEVLAKRLALGRGQHIFDLHVEGQTPTLKPPSRWAASLSRLTSWLL